MPIVLWYCWRDDNDRIPQSEPPINTRAKAPPNTDRRRDHAYELSLMLSASVRLFTSRAISVTDVQRAQRLIQLFCQMALRMGIHLTINHHLAMHYLKVFDDFGPVYAWWLFAYERFNGLLEKVNLNGHADGVMELTLMRAWVLRHRFYELVILSLRCSSFVVDNSIGLSTATKCN